jgi:hypothetical protein
VEERVGGPETVPERGCIAGSGGEHGYQRREVQRLGQGTVFLLMISWLGNGWLKEGSENRHHGKEALFITDA